MRSSLVVLLIVLAGGLLPAAAEARPLTGWAPDAQVPGYLDGTYTPVLVADHNRTVHALASQWVDEPDSKLAIVYRRWTLAGGWTEPVDVILAPGGEAQIMGAFLDSAGVLHIVYGVREYRSQETSIFHASAPAVDAGRTQAWSIEPVGEQGISPVSGALTGDEQGNLTLIYSGNAEGNGVYAAHSADGGLTWSEPKPIFTTYDTKLVPFSLRLFRGPAGRIHATWNVVTSRGTDMALYYAGYDENSAQWDEPVLLEERIDEKDFFGPSYPTLVDNGEFVVILYNSGNPFTGRPVDRGRPIQRVLLSADRGLTWQEPMDPFPFHVGRSGEHTLAVDGNRGVHAVFIQRIESLADGKYSITGGLWHSRMQGGVWSQPERLITNLAPHDVHIVISQGNVLLAAWREDPGSWEEGIPEEQHGIWYTTMMLDVSELSVTPLPTAQRTPALTATATPTRAPATAAAEAAAPHQPEVSLARLPSPTKVLAVGLAPVLLLLVGLSLVSRRSHRRHL